MVGLHARARRYNDRSLMLEGLLHGKNLAIGQQRSNMQFSTMSPNRTHCVTEETLGGQGLKIVVWDPAARRPVLTLPEPNARTASQLRFWPTAGTSRGRPTPAGRALSRSIGCSRKDLLPCNTKEVSAP